MLGYNPRHEKNAAIKISGNSINRDVQMFGSKAEKLLQIQWRLYFYDLARQLCRPAVVQKPDRQNKYLMLDPMDILHF